MGGVLKRKELGDYDRWKKEPKAQDKFEKGGLVQYMKRIKDVKIEITKVFINCSKQV